MQEQKPNSEQKDETLDSSSPNSTNTTVVGSQCLGTVIESGTVGGSPSLSPDGRPMSKDETTNLMLETKTNNIIKELQGVKVFYADIILETVVEKIAKEGRRRLENSIVGS
jgi:hypothetical protein